MTNSKTASEYDQEMQQINPRHREEEAKNNNSNITYRLAPVLHFLSRRMAYTFVLVASLTDGKEPSELD